MICKESIVDPKRWTLTYVDHINKICACFFKNLSRTKRREHGYKQRIQKTIKMGHGCNRNCVIRKWDYFEILQTKNGTKGIFLLFQHFLFFFKHNSQSPKWWTWTCYSQIIFGRCPKTNEKSEKKF